MSAPPFSVGVWRVEPTANRIFREGSAGPEARELELKVMDLLVLLAGRPGEVVTRAEIAKELWAGVTVNDDALSRTLWKLRRALEDDARAPRFVATVPKRGYRLLAEVQRGAPRSRRPVLAAAGAAAALLVAALLVSLVFSGGAEEAEDPASTLVRRADGFYGAYTRADNEAALALYEQALVLDPDHPGALAGLANALTQRELRFSDASGLGAERTSLGEALASEWLDTAAARRALDRARAFAERAVGIDPAHARGWRALGLARATLRDFEGARRAHERALVADPDAWGALVDLADLSGLEGREAEAADHMARPFDVMARTYTAAPGTVRRWQGEVGVYVAEARARAGEPDEAERWYRRVLAVDPVHPRATRGLAEVLAEKGEASAARALCEAFARRTGATCADG